MSKLDAFKAKTIKELNKEIDELKKANRELTIERNKWIRDHAELMKDYAKLKVKNK